MSLDINLFQQEKFQKVLEILKSKDKKFIIEKQCPLCWWRFYCLWIF